MKSLLLPSALIAVLLTAVIFLGGVRVIVAPDMPGINKAGAILIVANAHNLSLIESPEEFCAARSKSGNDMCLAGALAAMMENAKLLAKL